MSLSPADSGAGNHQISKAELRRSLRGDRRRFVADNPALQLISPLPQCLTLLNKAHVIAGYSATASEADPAEIIAAARSLGKCIALPRMTDDGIAMHFHEVRADATLLTGAFGQREPSAGSPVVTPDIILAPLVGFTRTGGRLGQGGGYYDRAFAGFPNALRIGIALSVQECAELPIDGWDMPLHHIHTEREWIGL